MSGRARTASGSDRPAFSASGNLFAAVVLVLAVTLTGCGGTSSDSPSAPSPDRVSGSAEEGDPLLDSLQRRTFAFFWETTPAETGLTPDRWPSQPFASVAAIGFALTAYPVGVERGYVSRPAAARRARRTLEFLWSAPQHGQARRASGYRGFFYHFLDMDEGRRYETVELSSIDTALLMAGVLTCMEYFDRGTEAERRIRSLADSLYRRVDWDWMQPRPPLVGMGWTPEDGFLDEDYEGYDEAMILYVLALGSPTHPIDPSAWPAYVSTYEWADFYGYEHVNFAPLFGHQYSHVWIDFRGIQDAYMREKGLTYFENAGLGRRGVPGNRPGADRGDAGEPPHGAHLAPDARERVRPPGTPSSRVRGGLAREVAGPGQKRLCCHASEGLARRGRFAILL